MKKFLSLILCALLVLLCVQTTYAHSGGTDSAGGHYDSSSGEYHYHHGYPAHDHYDMDGDGVADCPYAFDDKTGNQSGSSSYGSSQITTETASAKAPQISKSKSSETSPPTSQATEQITYAATPSNSPKSNTEARPAIESEEPIVELWIVFVMLGSCVIVIALLYGSAKAKEKYINELNNTLAEERLKSQKELNTLKAGFQAEKNALIKVSNQLEAILQEENDALKEEIEEFKIELDMRVAIKAKEQLEHRDKHIQMLQAENKRRSCEVVTLKKSIAEILSIKKRLSNINYVNNGLPVEGEVSEDKPFGNFTVFAANRGKCYHCDKFCGNGWLHAEHILDVVDKLPPCRKCVRPSSPPLSLLSDMRRLSEIETKAQKSLYSSRISDK